MPASSEEVFSILKNTKSLRDQVPVNKGNPESALAQASKKYEATYRWPFQLHGMIGPSCAVADVGKDSATIYTGTQGSFDTRKAVAELLGFPKKMFECSTERPLVVTGEWAPMMCRKMPPCFRARSASRFGFNGCAMTNMAGSPKVRR